MAKLLTLYLQNYRNIPEYKIDFEGKDGKIVGANRVGKTNCLEAICYLLTDKLLGGSADIPSIKPHHNTRAKVVVEGTFATDDGVITLRKEFYEKWVQPRGSATEELQGHSTDYYVNGAKQSKAKDFYEALELKFGIPTQLSGLDAYQLVLDPFYFGDYICGGKDWKFARKAVIEIVGDVTPEEIYARNPDAAIADKDLKAHQFDDGEAKQALRGEIEGYKKNRSANEILINDYQRAVDNDVSDDEYADAKTKSEAIDEQIANLKVGNENPYASEVTELQNELFDLQKEYGKTASAAIDRSESRKLQEELEKAKDDRAALERQCRSVEFDISQLNRELEEKEKAQTAFKKELEDLQFDYKNILVESVCPTCGQPLPKEKVDEAYNKKKAEIVEKGTKARNKAVENKQAIEKLKGQITLLKQRDFSGEKASQELIISNLEKRVAEARAKEDASVPTTDPKIPARIAEINARLAEIRDLQAKGNADVNVQIAELKMKKESYQGIFSTRIASENAKKKIAELKKTNVELGKRQADAEQRFWAVGEFVKTKLNLLDEHTASKLGEVRFQLIKENIKAGSYDEVCVPYIVNPATGKHTSTLFSDGSKSEQIYTGIQIIKAIRNAKGWAPLPIVFDQGGELDEVSSQKVAYDAEAQIIEVKVEGDSKKPQFIPFAL